MNEQDKEYLDNYDLIVGHLTMNFPIYFDLTDGYGVIYQDGNGFTVEIHNYDDGRSEHYSGDIDKLKRLYDNLENETGFYIVTKGNAINS